MQGSRCSGPDSNQALAGFGQFPPQYQYDAKRTCIPGGKAAVTSGFRRHADQISPLLGYDAALSGSYVPTFRDNLSGPVFKVKKSKWMDRVSRNVGTGLPLNAT
jgi:hypothetical protein